ncbi:MAG TPA: tol-pal system protein YbgF [Xanthobacteraceae bacterium]|nr:tol-pal system protein YbgF [Xanthobacteraceae bacterium]
MFRSTLRLIAAPAIAASMAMAPCAASAQGFLNDLFGNSDRVSPSTSSPDERAPQQRAPQQQGTVAQSQGQELSQRIGRLEAQIRELTGAIEQLQYRNQQLEAQLQRVQGGGGAPAPAARGPAAPPQQQMQPQAQPPQVQPPQAPAPGRRGDAFDPSQNPSAPGVGRVLGQVPAGGTQQAPVAQTNPQYQAQPQYDDDEVGAPGGRAAGAPLDLSRPPGAGGYQQGGSANDMQAPPQRGPGGAGAQVATLPPSDSPRDNYDMAYGYITRKDYALAEDGFRNFLRRFPSDRLVPEAQYWLGETMFQRQRYRDAAEQFLGVSTKFETNARAPDALLRLGQSLAAMGEREAACASLAEVLRKYPRASVAVRQGVDREQKRVRC